MEGCPFRHGCSLYDAKLETLSSQAGCASCEEAQERILAREYLKKYCNDVGFGRCQEFLGKGGMSVLETMI